MAGPLSLRYGVGIFIKLTGPRRYVQLAESYRDDEGREQQRTIASLGRVEQIEQHVETIVRGLLHRATARKASTRPTTATSAKPAIRRRPARALVEVWALTARWKEHGLDRLGSVFRRGSRRQIPVEQLLCVMVFNRLCDPEYKLGVSRWLERECVPGIETDRIPHQHLLRAMEALLEHNERDRVDEVIASLLRPLLDVELSVVFYDLTAIAAGGLSEQSDDVRRFGRSKDGGIRRPFVLGVVQTREGLPIHPEVLMATLRRQRRYPPPSNASWRASEVVA